MIEPGQICRDLSRKTFKAVIVLGPSLKGGKLRVCRWQPDNDVAGGHWCPPNTLLESQLQPLTSDFDLTSRRGLVVAAARRAIVDGHVRWRVSRSGCANLVETHYIGAARP